MFNPQLGKRDDFLPEPMRSAYRSAQAKISSSVGNFTARIMADELEALCRAEGIRSRFPLLDSYPKNDGSP